MPPLTPTSSQEIVPISPPTVSTSSLKPRRTPRRDAATTLPRGVEPFDPSPELKRKIARHLADEAPRKVARKGSAMEERERVGGMSRARTTERMVRYCFTPRVSILTAILEGIAECIRVGMVRAMEDYKKSLVDAGPMHPPG